MLSREIARIAASGLAALGLLVLGEACGTSSSPADDPPWPARPGDGTPLVFELDRVERAGDRPDASLWVFNFADQHATGAQLELTCLDASGREVGRFPWSIARPPRLVTARRAARIAGLGLPLPPTTERLLIAVVTVDFADSTTWTRDRR